jgi:hypothetical protein
MPTRSIIRRIEKSDDDFFYMGGDEDEGKRAKGADKYKDELDGFKAPKGMNHDRSCCNGDTPFAAIFIVFLGSMIGLTYLGYKDGDVNKLIAPVVTVDGAP